VKIDNRVAPMALKLLVLVVVAGLCQGGGAIRCVCSSPAECEPLSDTDCPNGSALVWDPCGCCRVCARLEFEPCGGPDGFHGTCAAGLECVADHADLQGTCKSEYTVQNTLVIDPTKITSFTTREVFQREFK
jgi:Insulin-like growth factor binding protein